MFPGLGDETFEIFKASQIAEDIFVAALCCAYRPGTATVAGLCLWIIVTALPKHASDGMNRRQVNNVEAKFCDVGQALFTVGECAVSAWLLCSGTRKELVP